MGSLTDEDLPEPVMESANIEDVPELRIKPCTADLSEDDRTVTIEDLPEPVMEYIFSYLSPYRDLKKCMLVNRSWRGYVYGVVRKIRRDFTNAITTANIVWSHRIAEPGPTISKRYSHSACCCGDSMYVFGGCTTASTTFNDLWRLDLTTRCWIRPLATGTYPPPKACATLVSYGDNLVLFGGWTHTSPFPLHQQWRVFDHLHLYNVTTNRWTQVVTPTICPAMAGHSATVHGDNMIVFGGIQKQPGEPLPRYLPQRINFFCSSNDIWILDLKVSDWRIQPASTPPPPRYGHSQIAVDEKHILVIGGCGGPNMLLNDVWLLTMDDKEWYWKEMEIRCPENAAPFLSFNAACKVGDQVVIMNRTRKSKVAPNALVRLLRPPSHLWSITKTTDMDSVEVNSVPPKPPDSDSCVNGKKGYLKRHLERRQQYESSSSDEDEVQLRDIAAKKIASQQNVPNSFNEPSTSGLGTSASTSSSSHHDHINSQPSCSHDEGNQRPIVPVRPNSRRNRLRQLESLDRMERRIRDLRANCRRIPIFSIESTSPYLGSAKHPMCLFVMDISHAISDGYVTWREPQLHMQNAPEETILYSLVLGRGELVMFGGIQKDLNSRPQEGENVPEIVSNSLHFVSAERHVI